MLKATKTATKSADLRQIGTGFIAGVLLALSFPPYGLPLLLPVGFALLLVALRSADLRTAAYTGFACGFAYFGGTLFWLANLFGAASVSLVAITAVFPTLFAMLFVLLRRRLPKLEWILPAILWTGLEYFRSEPFILSFGWVGFGYGVVNSVFWAGIASIVGTYGVTFLIVLLSTLAVSLRKPDWRFAVLVAGWLVTLYLAHSRPTPTHPLNVRLVQAFSDDTESLLALSKPQPTVNPAVIVWPEYSIHDDAIHHPKLWKCLQEVAITNNAYFIFGAMDIPDPRNEEKFYNTAYLLDPKGQLVGKHIKNHLVHFIKDGIRGTESKAFTTDVGKLGVAICFDIDYPDVARRLTEDGAEVLLVPNMDPAEWGNVQRQQHRLMFQMRAAECGRYLARADVAGGTSVCAPNGQVIASVTTADATALDVAVGRETRKTPFILGGWRFGQLCLIFTGIALVFSLRPWAKRTNPLVAKGGS